MNVTAWNNGIQAPSGAGYGLKVKEDDRDQHFREAWGSVTLVLPNGTVIQVNIDKASFWGETCRELIHKEIGRWLRESGHAPWEKGKPPTFKLRPTGEAGFEIEERDS